MKAVIQRVKHASVVVDGVEVGACGEGLMILLGVAQGDSEEDAKLLADMIEKKHGVKVEIITDVGPVLGAHSGPGTLAFFFVGSER